jgi:hypothetical protein
VAARRGMSACIPVGSAAAVEFRRYDHRTPILTLRADRASLGTLMARMGHSSTRAAFIYLHSTADRQREIAGDHDIAGGAGGDHRCLRHRAPDRGHAAHRGPRPAADAKIALLSQRPPQPGWRVCLPALAMRFGFSHFPFAAPTLRGRHL